MTPGLRADASRNREAILVAADALFAHGQAVGSVSMDDVAAAAGVGKGTLFRHFNDRSALINAVYRRRTEPLRKAITEGPAPLGPGTPPRQRVAAILDAMLRIKLDNRHLSRALEHADGSCGGDGYNWVHGILTAELQRTRTSASPSWIAHALLATINADLIDQLRDQERMTEDQIQSNLASFISTLLGPDTAGQPRRSRSDHQDHKRS